MLWRNTIATVVTLFLSVFVYFANAVYRHRSRINQLRKQGVVSRPLLLGKRSSPTFSKPMPKNWNWITGHLLVLQKFTDGLPPDANVNLALADLCVESGDTEILLMDYWPVYPPLFLVHSPEVAMQVSTKLNLAKTEQMGKSLLPITGGQSLISMNGDEWKMWRNLFNPGFSATSMMGQVPHIVDYVMVFSELLRENAGKGIIYLDDLTTRLTMDIIIKVTIDADLDYQRLENVLATALGYITRWHSFWDPRILMNPLRPFIQWYYGRVMDTFIRTELDKRFLESMTELVGDDSVRSKSVIALALQSYIESSASKGVSQQVKLDDRFSRFATNQIRLFLFAGNDTTSSSIVYTFHLLSKHPEALANIRQEHDEVFGTTLSTTANALKKQPALLNQCRYTLAVIKETLRLYSPASTMRAPRVGTVVTDRHNTSYMTDEIGVMIVHQAVHLNSRVWSRPTEFLPERFLVDVDHDLYPKPGAYRPFEKGPRACIGQTLVYDEMRTVLVLTAREFDLNPAYQEWDALQEQNEGLVKKMRRRMGLVSEHSKTVHGDRAYQTEKAGTHPSDGYPCRITSRKGK